VGAEKILAERGLYRFHRGSVACALSMTDERVFWGHLGVNPGTPYHGRLFVNARGVRLYKVTMPETGNPALDDRWWLGFEGSRPYSFDATLEELKIAADFLTAG
jgi:hypothetical protein